MSRFNRQAASRRILKQLESKKSVRLYTEDDTLPDDKYFVSIPTADVPELKVDGDVVLVGPFDSPDAAQSAAGGDATVVNDEGTPVVDAEPAPGGAPPPGGGDLSTIPESRRKRGIVAGGATRMEALRAQVLKDIREAEDTVQDVDTDITAVDLSTDDGAGSNVQAGNPDGVANAAPVDGAPVHTALDVDTDADVSANDATNSSPGADKAGTGTTLSKAAGNASVAVPEGAELDANGGDISESFKGEFIGNFCLVREKKTNARVDSGVVSKVSKESIWIDSNEYKFAQYNITRLA